VRWPVLPQNCADFDDYQMIVHGQKKQSFLGLIRLISAENEAFM
jgi:hypothetical protein